MYLIKRLRAKSHAPSSSKLFWKYIEFLLKTSAFKLIENIDKVFILIDLSTDIKVFHWQKLYLSLRERPFYISLV